MLKLILLILACICFALDLVDFKLGTFGKWIPLGLIFFAVSFAV